MKAAIWMSPVPSGDDEAARARLELVMGNVPWQSLNFHVSPWIFMPPYG